MTGFIEAKSKMFYSLFTTMTVWEKYWLVVQRWSKNYKSFLLSTLSWDIGHFTIFTLLFLFLLQMLQRSLVAWWRTRGRGTQPTSAVRWRLTPVPPSSGSEKTCRCPAPTPPTSRSTTRRPAATWRWAAPAVCTKTHKRHWKLLFSF